MFPYSSSERSEQFWKQNTFFTCSWKFLRTKKIKFKLENNWDLETYKKSLKSSMFSLRLVHFEPQLLFLDISYFGFSDLYAPGKITVVECFHFVNKFQVFLIILELMYPSNWIKQPILKIQF